MADAITMKRGDRRPAVTSTVKDSANAVVDITGATIKFSMANWDGVAKISLASASVVAPGTDGKVQFEWLAGHTDEAGAYRAEFEITFADGRKMSAPNSGHIPVHIVPDLA